MSKLESVVQGIIAGARRFGGPALGQALGRLARGEPVDAPDEVLRLGWLTLVREPAGYPAGLVTGRLSLDLLAAGGMSVDEFLDDRRAFAASQSDYVFDERLPPRLRWSANYVHGVLDATGPSLVALVQAPAAELAGRPYAYPAGADAQVVAWIEGRFEPQTASDHLHLAEALAGEDPERALTLLGQGHALTPDDARFHRARAGLAIRHGRWREAEVELQAYLAKTPTEDLTAIHDLGVAAAELGDHEEAVSRFTRVLTAEPDHLAALSNRAFAFGNLGRFEDGLRDTSRHIELDPQDPAPYYNRALHRHRLGDARGALEDLDQALALDPDYGAAYNNRGMIRAELGDSEGAVDDFTEGLAVSGTNALMLFNRARALERLGQLDEAIEDLTAALEVSPSFEALLARSRLFEQRGVHWRTVSDCVTVVRVSSERTAGVEEALERLRRVGYDQPIAYPLPHDPTALVEAGHAHERAQDLASARAAYERALAIDPGLVDALYNLGNLHLAAQELDLAVALFSRALDVAPHDHQSRLNRGTAYLQQAVTSQTGALVERAALDFRLAIEAAPTYPAGYLKLAAMERMEGRLYGALVLYVAAGTLLDPADPRAEAVRAELSQHVWPNLSPDARDEAADALDAWVPELIRLNVLQTVVTLSETLLEHAPAADEADLWTYMAAAYWRGGLDDRAHDALDRALEVDAAHAEDLLGRLVDDGVLSDDVWGLVERG